MAFLDETGLATLWGVSKDNFGVSADTSAALGLSDATVDDALGKLKMLIGECAQIEAGSYTGTGTGNSDSDSTKYNTLTFDFEPKVLFVGDSKKEFRINLSGAGFIAVKGAEGTWAMTPQSYPKYRFVDNAVQWHANSAAAQYNTSGTIYAYVAIG